MAAIDDRTRATAMLISSALFRACLVGFGVLILTCFPMLVLDDQVYFIHSSMIDIPREEYNALIFTAIADLKILIIVVLLLPAIGIHWTLKVTS